MRNSPASRSPRRQEIFDLARESAFTIAIDSSLRGWSIMRCGALSMVTRHSSGDDCLNPFRRFLLPMPRHGPSSRCGVSGRRLRGQQVEAGPAKPASLASSGLGTSHTVAPRSRSQAVAMAHGDVLHALVTGSHRSLAAGWRGRWTAPRRRQPVPVRRKLLGGHRRAKRPAAPVSDIRQHPAPHSQSRCASFGRTSATDRSGSSGQFARQGSRNSGAAIPERGAAENEEPCRERSTVDENAQRRKETRPTLDFVERHQTPQVRQLP